MSSKNKKKRWYAYIHGNPLSSESYFMITVQPGFGTGTQIASVFAKGYAEYPEEFSPEIKIHIANALATGVSQPAGSEKTLVLLKG